MQFNHAMSSHEPMQVDQIGEDHNDNDGFIADDDLVYNVENATLDLETIVQGFVGLTRILRLKFIAQHCSALRVEALKLAIEHVMESHNTTLYQELHKMLTNSVGVIENSSNSSVIPDVASKGFDNRIAPLDMAWIETRNKKAALKLEKLDTDLKNYKSSSIKESIRRGHDDLGDHFLDCGDLVNAMKCYSRARDYCISGAHVIRMCLNVVKVSIYLQNWPYVTSYVNKANSATESIDAVSSRSSDIISSATHLSCAHGLSEMATGHYKSAAFSLIRANVDYCTDMPELLSAQNVVVYGGVCALATFDRSELYKHVISSSTFKLFLELDSHLREVIFNFYASKYGKCLTMLDEIKDNLLLDLYMAPHVPKLYAMIRNRALIQYFSPYMSADLYLMAASFNVSVQLLEKELVAIILDGQIQARIDSHNKVIYAHQLDERAATFQKALAMGSAYQRQARMTLLRSVLVKNNIVVQTVNSGGSSAAPVSVQSVAPSCSNAFLNPLGHN